MDWLVGSIVLSVVLTVVLNVGLRSFPGIGDRAARRVDEAFAPRDDGSLGDGRRVRVWFPWKGMLVASVVLTVLLNLVARLA